MQKETIKNVVKAMLVNKNRRLLWITVPDPIVKTCQDKSNRTQSSCPDVKIWISFPTCEIPGTGNLNFQERALGLVRMQKNRIRGLTIRFARFLAAMILNFAQMMLCPADTNEKIQLARVGFF